MCSLAHPFLYYSILAYSGPQGVLARNFQLFSILLILTRNSFTYFVAAYFSLVLFQLFGIMVPSLFSHAHRGT